MLQIAAIGLCLLAVAVVTGSNEISDQLTIAEADAIRRQGIKILSVGVGIQNQEELEGISADPRNVFNVRNFAVLDTIRPDITQRICEDDVTTTPEPETTTPEPETTTPDYVCEDKLLADIYFLGDSSNSIASPGWQKELNFISKVSEAFPLGPDDVQFAFGIFSTNFEHIFDLNAYTDQAALAHKVQSTKQIKSNTFTFDALNAVNRNGYLTNLAHGGGRRVPKILIVITDGQSHNVTRTIAEADAIRSQNIQILSVGVGIQNQEELEGISADPRNVFNVRTFAVLDTIRPAITQRICEVSVTTPSPVPETPPPEPETTEEDAVCEDKLLADIYFLGDSSNSIASPGWQKELNFISKVSEAFQLGPDDVQVGFGIFSTNFDHIFDVNAYTDQAALAHKVQSTKQIKSNTFTFDALNAVNRNGYLTNLAHGGARRVPKILIVITDGQSHDVARTIAEADAIRSQNIQILSVGVGIQNQEELEGISADPRNVFNVRNFAVLDTIRPAITQRICDVSVTTPTPVPETTEPEPTTPEPTTPEPTTEEPTTPEPTTEEPTPPDVCRTLKPCQHECDNKGEEDYVCSCRDGFVVSPSDPTKCVDINECTKKPCQHVCTNTEGSFVCSCNPGFAVNPADPTKCQEPICVKELAADIYFLGDSSNSIASPGWQKELNFITKVTEAFRLGPDDVQVGFGIFSTNFKHIFNLDGYTDQAALAHAVLSTKQLKSNTYTFDALDAVNENGFLTNAAFGGGRNVPKILIVITDGQSQDIARTIQAASNLRKNNITIFSVGVGLTNAIELQGIAGNAGNVFSVRTFALLDTIRGEITQSVCYAPIPPQVKECPEAGLHDLIFVVDSVNTLGTANVDRSLLLISSILNAFTVDENNVKVSVVMSDKTPRVLFNLTSSLQVVYESLAAVTNLNINTHTYTGLLYAADFFTPENGAREGATKTIVLLSDGKSSDPLSVIADAEDVKTRGINVVTLGILPEADLKELSDIASKPQNNIQARNYISLPSAANQVAQAACRGS